MRQMMRQIPPIGPGEEVLLPSCGAAIATVVEGAVITPTCVDVVLDDPTPPENSLVTATATLRRGNGTVLPGQTLNWRVMQGLQILAQGSGTTDANGEITFSFTVGGAGLYEFIASFFGNPEPPGLPDAQKWIGCSRSACPTGGFPPALPQPMPEQTLGAPFCGLGCGQNVCDSDGLEPTD